MSDRDLRDLLSAALGFGLICGFTLGVSLLGLVWIGSWLI